MRRKLKRIVAFLTFVFKANNSALSDGIKKKEYLMRCIFSNSFWYDSTEKSKILKRYLKLHHSCYMIPLIVSILSNVNEFTLTKKCDILYNTTHDVLIYDTMCTLTSHFFKQTFRTYRTYLTRRSNRIFARTFTSLFCGYLFTFTKK